MKLLITGASGFIGVRLVSAACAALGAENVIAFTSKPVDACLSIVYHGSDFNLSAADLALLDTVEVLIHVGAFTPKNGLLANAIEECNGNIYFTEKLLALPLGNLKKIIYISTIDVYEPAELTTEETPTLPASLYGWSKLYCERMTSIFAANHRIACQTLRIGHVYGPGEEKYAKFLPKAIKNIAAGEAVELWGDGSEVRSFIYIDDVVAAILQAVNLRTDVGPINVVGGAPVTIRALLDQLIAVSGRQVTITAREFNGIKRNYVFDAAKLRQHLLPIETDLNTGLRIEYDYMAGLV
jgi:UDP-glucose 4-epimerase